MFLNFFSLLYKEAICHCYCQILYKYLENGKTPCGYTSDIGKKKTINKAQHFPSEVRRCAVANHWHLI